MDTNRKRIALLAAVLSASINLMGQTAPLNGSGARGMSPTGSYTISDIETVDNTSGNLTVRIPLASFPPGRAGQTAGVGLIYNSAIYDTAPDGFGKVNLTPSTTGGGWQYSYQYSVNVEVLPTNAGACGYQTAVVFPDGSRHVLYYWNTNDLLTAAHSFDGYYGFDPRGTGGSLCQSSPSYALPLTYHTEDGTYVRVLFGAVAGGSTNWMSLPWTIYFADGSKVTGFGGQTTALIDKNNNTITVQNFDDAGSGPTTVLTDSAQRTITIAHVLQYPGKNPVQDTITQAGWNGSTLTWNVYWTTSSPTSGSLYGCDGGVAICTRLPSNTVVDHIDAPPAGSFQPTYTFAYSPTDSLVSSHWPAPPSPGVPTSVWGELMGIGLPSGAVVTYNYKTNDSIRQFDSLLQSPISMKAVSRCEQADQAGSTCGSTLIDVWKYSSDATQTSCTQLARNTTGPDGGTSTTCFNSSSPTTSTTRGMVTKTIAPDGSTTQNSWGLNPPGNPVTGFDNASTYVHLRNPYLLQTTRSAGPTAASTTTFGYNVNGVLKSRTEQALTGSATRTTTTVPALAVAAGDVSAGY